MSEPMIIKSVADFKILEDILKQRWLELQDIPNVFRYKLNVQKQKILNGKLKFVAQLNTDRYSLRRPPQTITSMVQPFNENVFNFKKVNEKEILLQCRNQLSTNPSNDGIITFLINNSPLTKYHSLICPRVHEGLPQIITKECIEFAINIIFGFNDRSYRIGYNSLGAFASVNHLHIHLFHVPEKLYVEDAEIKPITNDIYRMDFPAFALCLPIFTWTDSGIVASKVLKIVDYFCTKSIPHNLFWTLGTHSDQQTVRIYIFPRNNMTDKNSNSFNVALCELGGYFPVGDSDIYDSLTEDFLLDHISTAMEPIDREAIILDVMDLLSNENDLGT